MDSARFDRLARTLSSRRTALAGLAAGVGALLGFNSTALMSCAALHGTPALRLVIPELAAVEGSMTADQRSLLEQFLPAVVTPGTVAAALRATRGQPSAQ